ncbi:MAG: aminotransferase class III-fold pyridoxal phosphate-dependent enzyme, partial [Phycisphaerae bacterium]|nr:aminotransferase class III-fold pyridoxal phosphate-dependent enzyme [Phycisphaerae bacterium]
FNNCFHGRTMGALSLTPQKYQKGFEPMLPGSIKVDMGDIGAVAAAVDNATAGIFIEPIQGEGGVNIPPKKFMQDLRALCDKKNLLLVCDEVWTAPARTGKWFAYQHYDITPDVLTGAKAIGGGLPVGVCVAAQKYQDVLVPGTHASTMGGNPVCAAAGAAAMKLIEDEGLVERAAAKGDQIMQALGDAGIGAIKEVRGAGLMIAIELDRDATDVLMGCMDRGLLINCAQQTVLRLAPPLTTPDEDLQEGLDILMDALRG